MPIKGLTDAESSFPCIGKLRKGAPKETKTRKDGGKYEIQGKDLSYFRFDTGDRKAMSDFTAAYGEQPTHINVLFPYPDVDANFFTCKEEWSAGGLVHRCDGETCMALRLPNGKMQTSFAAPVLCPGGCKQVGRLKVIVPELRRFAYVTAETHSINDIVNLYRQLSAAYVTFGQLNKLPFVLQRRPQMISTPTQDGTRARREKWMLSIEIDPVWSERQLEATRHALSARAAIYQGEIDGVEPLALPPSMETQAIALPRRPDIPDWWNSETWKSYKYEMERASTPDRVQKLQAAILQRIEQGVLPNTRAIKEQVWELGDRALDRIRHTSQAVDVEVVQEPPPGDRPLSGEAIADG